jgi:transposase
VRDIRRKSRKKYSTEEKIRIVLEGLRGEDSIAGICRREGISPNLYYRWSKDFWEAGKKRLAGDTVRKANSSEVNEFKRERIKQETMNLRRKQNLSMKSTRQVRHDGCKKTASDHLPNQKGSLNLKQNLPQVLTTYI